jgi:hypothetical protein
MIEKFKLLFNKSEMELTKFIELNPNFKLLKKGRTSYIQINKKTKIEDVEQLLEILWNDKSEITFHDIIHPTLSDPGAYFSYSTEKSENKKVWSMTYGNHGWSGGIYHLSEKTLAKQITNLIHKTPMNEIQITDVCFFSHYEIKDRESSLKKDSEIFEMHDNN